MPNIANFFTGGANTNVSPFIQPEDQPTVLNGCNPSYKLGSILKDTGYERVSTQLQANKSILGLYDFHQDATTQRMFATVDDATSDDTQLFAKTPAGAWSEILAAETAWANVAGANTEMVGFIGYLFIVGHSSTDGFLPVASVINTTFSTSTNVTNMAQGKYIVRYRDRLYVGNTRSGGTDYPYRAYFSSVPSAGAITWTPASDFIDVGYGKQITGMGVNWDKLLIFTDDETWMYDQTQKKPVWDYGCANHRTIKNSGPYMIWCGHDNVYVSASGGFPDPIGGEVIDFIRSGTPSNFFAEIIDEEYWLYVGNVTVSGVSYSNVVLTFNIPTSQWRWRELYNDMTVFARHSDGGPKRLYMGSASGEVWDKGKYTDSTLKSEDAIVSGSGQPIGSNFELAPFHLGSMSLSKALNNLYVYAERAGGLQLKARVLDRNSQALTPYKPLGQLRSFANSFHVDVDDGVLLQIAGSEYGSNPYWQFYGYELQVDIHGEEPIKK